MSYRLNSGCRCSFDKYSSFFVCVAHKTLVNNGTDDNNFGGKTLVNMLLFSQTFDSRSARAFNTNEAGLFEGNKEMSKNPKKLIKINENS